MCAEVATPVVDLARIREYARHQHQRGVELVEIQEGDRLISIRVDGRCSSSGVDATTSTPPDAAAEEGSCVARSEALGVLRLSHATKLPTAIAKGDAVEKGQPLALLELGDTLTPVNAPASGMVEAILADDGQRVDYGMPLFRLTPTRR